MKHVQRTLAIKGDSKNGKEIISLLELFGADNIHKYNGTDTNVYYFINDVCNYIIDTYRDDSPKQLEYHLAFYTLDDFKARFPYKIGEKVDVIGIRALRVGCEILNMQWNEEYNGIMYYVQDAIGKYWWVKADDIRYTKYSDLKIDLDDNVNKNIEFDLSKYSYEIRDGKLIIEEKKPIYPKTIDECVKLLGVDFRLDMDSYKRKLMANFYRLILCRDAYWKIAGDEMGLGKPWEPEYVSLEDNTYFIIQTFNGEIDKSATSHRNAVLAFPTIEMRDAFYENFKDLIESCKELI